MKKDQETNGSDASGEEKAGSAKSGRKTEAKSMWSGSITFGLVNIPIRVVPGVRRKTVHFHLLHAKDNARLQRKFFCSLEHKEVPSDEIKKGFDRGGGEHVIVEKEELEKLYPKGERSIDILYFVDHKDIDPAYFDQPYYLRPEKSALKSYQILAEALTATGKAGIAQFVMRNKQYIGIVRADGPVLSLETMHFDDEVITPKELDWAPAKSAAKSAEVKVAQNLIESLSTKFEPQKLKDHYREAVMKLIDRKASKKTVMSPMDKKEEPDSNVIDLMSALQASLNQVKKGKKKLKAAA